VTEGKRVITGAGFNLILSSAEFTGATEQAELPDESLHTTASLSEMLLIVYVLLLVPTFLPFSSHWKIGLTPAFTVVAVKVIGVPRHTSVSDAETVMTGTRPDCMLIRI
jgi:hypothetical protein